MPLRGVGGSILFTHAWVGDLTVRLSGFGCDGDACWNLCSGELGRMLVWICKGCKYPADPTLYAVDGNGSAAISSFDGDMTKPESRSPIWTVADEITDESRLCLRPLAPNTSGGARVSLIS